MSFDDESREAPSSPSSAPSSRLVASCRCGRSFDLPAWLRADLVGYQPDAGGVLELRNCACGSTHSVEILPIDARYPGALLQAIERLARFSPGRKIAIRSDGEILYVDVTPKGSGPYANCCGNTLEDALQAAVEALPPATKPSAVDDLFGLTTDREPLTSADRDSRPEEQT